MIPGINSSAEECHGEVVGDGHEAGDEHGAYQEECAHCCAQHLGAANIDMWDCDHGMKHTHMG